MRNGLVEGVSLRAVLRESEAMAPEAAASVLAGMLVTLAVVHGDVRPEHVSVDSAGAIALTDFGGAGARFVPNSPSYMAPERLQGGLATESADVFSATAVFFECLTNESPFVAATRDDLAALHEYAEVIAEFAPPEMRTLAQHGLAPDPARRAATPHTFLDEVTATASAEYGADWQQRGRALLSGWAAAAARAQGAELAAPAGRAGLAEALAEAPPVGEPIDEALLGAGDGDAAEAADAGTEAAQEMPPPIGEPIDAELPETKLPETEEVAPAATPADPEPVADQPETSPGANEAADDKDYDWFTGTAKNPAEPVGAEADVLAAFDGARTGRTTDPEPDPYTPSGFDVFAGRSGGIAAQAEAKNEAKSEAKSEAEAEPVSGHWDEPAAGPEPADEAVESAGAWDGIAGEQDSEPEAQAEAAADEDDPAEVAEPVDETDSLTEVAEPIEDALIEPADAAEPMEAAASEDVLAEAASVADSPAEEAPVEEAPVEAADDETDALADAAEDAPAEDAPAEPAEVAADDLGEEDDSEFEPLIEDSSELLAAFDAFAPSTPAAAPEPELELETPTEAEAELETESEPEAEAALESGPEPEAEPEIETESEPEPEADLEAEAEATAEPESALEPEADADADADSKPDSKPDSEPDLSPTTPADLEDDWVFPAKPSPKVPRSLSAFAVSLPSLPRPQEAEEPKAPVQTSAPDDWFRPGVAEPVGEDAHHTQVLNPDRDNTLESEATRMFDEVPVEVAEGAGKSPVAAEAAARDDEDDDDFEDFEDFDDYTAPGGPGGPRRKTLVGAVTTAVLLVAGAAAAVMLGGSGKAPEGTGATPSQTASSSAPAATAAPTPTGTSDGGDTPSSAGAPSSHRSSTHSRSKASSPSSTSHSSSEEATTQSSSSNSPTDHSSSSQNPTSSASTTPSSSCSTGILGLPDCGGGSSGGGGGPTTTTSSKSSGN
ncbi:hypothetical protein ABIA31_004082 [Catenulispora sp. MAP5-51]|uniref:serine/threonine-protein kinase n=1 Tax=Catenulispora sp. MAP5-51 TaxID=3156298 RepID=UPI0035120CEA